MNVYVDLSDGRIHIALLFLVSLLALVMVLTVRFSSKEEPIYYKQKGYHTNGFDFKSFKDLWIVGVIALPFIIVYILRDYL